MDPAVLSALIYGGSALATAGTQTSFNAARNKKQRAWSEKMYQRQYDDNLALWNLQNEYNNPASQMQRYKDAGLSPHLVYGAGTAGTAANIDAPTPPSLDLQTPDISELGRGIQGATDSYFQVQTQQEQMKQIKTNIDSMEANQYKTLIDAAQQLFDLKLDIDTRADAVKGRQGDALKKYGDGVISDIEAQISQALKSDREEAMSSTYLNTVNRNLLQNWDAVAQLDFRKTGDGERMLNEFIKAGLSKPVAMAVQAALHNEMLTKDIQYYDANMITGIISKVLGGLPGIGSFLGNIKKH